MKKILYTFVFFTIMGFYTDISACLPGGIVFTSQQQIDDFSIDYPGCTEIEGFLKIKETISGNITNLNGLSSITKINGYLEIKSNDALNDLSGLSNLSYLNHYLNIWGNSSLTSLTGLEGINTNSISFIIKIRFNDQLVNLSGLDGLTFIDGLEIKNNNSLINLSGLDNITSIMGDIDIMYNPALVNMEGLEAVVEFDGSISIVSNDELLNLSGFNNFPWAGSITITDNNKLESVSSLGNLSTIHNVVIGRNPKLISLTGFENTITIGGYLSIFNNDILEDLTGFDNVTLIGNGLFISNNAALINLKGLDNLTTNNENFTIYGNPSLENLTGLESIVTMGGFIEIFDNEQLSSLDGIQNIDATTINSINDEEVKDLNIYDNPNLSECSVLSICNFLDLTGKTKNIHDNMVGCNNATEIKDACVYPTDCSYLIGPFDGDTNVNITSELKWQEAAEATGYILTVGTEPNGTDILDNFDVGNTLTYKTEDFPCESEIFVTIKPYNTLGIAQNCDEEVFYTEEVIAETGDNIAICYGDSVQLEASGGTTYSWSPANDMDNPNIYNPMITPTVTKNYSVTVSNEGRCAESDIVTVVVHNLPIPNASATNETKNNANDGIATCVPTEGKPTYSFLWNNDKTTQSIDSLIPQSYSVIVTDNFGCIGYDTIVVKEFICPTLLVNSTLQNTTCNHECNGAIIIDSISNGLSPLTYTWSNGVSTASNSNLCAGSYTLTITDANNCSISEIFTITEPDNLLVNASSTDESATGMNDGFATCSPNGGTPPYFYKWSTGDTQQSIGSLVPGNYIVIVTDSMGCSSSDTVNISKAPAALLVNATQINVSCYGESNGSIKIKSIENGVSPYSYIWNTGSNDAFLININSGHYAVSVTDNDGKTITKEFDITEPEEISIIEMTTQNIKTDTLGSISIVVNNSENYTYLWIGPNGYTNTSKNIDNLDIEGCYTLVITDILSSCSIEDSVCISKTVTNTNELSRNEVAVYPNPVKDILNIDFLSLADSEADILIYDLTGKQRIKTKKTNTDKILKIDTQSLKLGIYILEINSLNGYLHHKLVIGK